MLEGEPLPDNGAGRTGGMSTPELKIKPGCIMPPRIADGSRMAPPLQRSLQGSVGADGRLQLKPGPDTGSGTHEGGALHLICSGVPENLFRYVREEFMLKSPSYPDCVFTRPDRTRTRPGYLIEHNRLIAAGGCFDLLLPREAAKRLGSGQDLLLSLITERDDGFFPLIERSLRSCRHDSMPPDPLSVRLHASEDRMLASAMFFCGASVSFVHNNTSLHYKTAESIYQRCVEAHGGGMVKAPPDFRHRARLFDVCFNSTVTQMFAIFMVKLYNAAMRCLYGLPEEHSVNAAAELPGRPNLLIAAGSYQSARLVSSNFSFPEWQQDGILPDFESFVDLIKKIQLERLIFTCCLRCGMPYVSERSQVAELLGVRFFACPLCHQERGSGRRRTKKSSA